MGHNIQCVSKSPATESATLWKGWRGKLPFVRQSSKRRGLPSPRTHMILPNSTLEKSLTVVRPKDQVARLQTEPTVDAEGFEKAMLHLSESGWYWGLLTAAEAKQILEEAVEGAFLVRKSSNPAYLFTLSVRTNVGPTHLRIEFANGMFAFDSVALARPQLKQFRSAVDLVQYYALAYQRTASPQGQIVAPANCFENGNGREGTADSETLTLKLTRPLHKKPGTLQHLCRKAINQYSHCHKDLPLPDRLKDFLLEYPFLL